VFRGFEAVPELLVVTGRQHEAGQFQDFIGWEAVRDSNDAQSRPLD
jgi:hypothetical protein